MGRKEILFTIAQDGSYNSTNQAEKLEGLHRKGFDQYYDPAFLETYIDNLRRGNNADAFSFKWYPHNAPGQWMSQNIAAPSTLITEPITLERTAEELDSGRFSHLVVATYLSGYSTFKQIVQYAHDKHPEVEVIAASVGALVPESAILADAIVKGDQIGGLRRIIGQSDKDPLKVVTVQSDTQTTFNGATKNSSYALLMSSFGCMYGCDFCPSTAQSGTEYTAPFSAKEIRQSIVDVHERIAPKSDVFTVSVAEPQGLGNVKLWMEVLRLCRDLPFLCDLVTTTSSKVIDKYGLDELTTGNLRLSTVNIGVESLLRGYQKNRGVDLKGLNGRLQSAGINVVSTFIVGFDWQTKKNVREEVRLLKDLGSSGYIVANLEMQPGTPLYTAYKKSGRLLDVPPELLSFYGYQAYIHPEFRSGFNDMLPLLDEIESELAEGNSTLGRNLQVFMNRRTAAEQKIREDIAQKIVSFRQTLDPSAYNDGGVSAVEAYTAQLYFRYGFRQIDLFHPFILSTN